MTLTEPQKRKLQEVLEAEPYGHSRGWGPSIGVLRRLADMGLIEKKEVRGLSGIRTVGRSKFFLTEAGRTALVAKET